ncbi:MAG: hypothetical protein AUK47_24660 [Deltaproteobacteria bacterium CG2_30_63_29]|nr:MAG: hypothetical protein AUK47_24660 [Deltaproteobacteria bacterium CG2_30_63_29]
MLVPGNRLIPLSRLWPEKSCRRASPASADFTFKGTDYLRYTKRLLDLQRDCQMEDLGRVDHFLNFVYWRASDDLKS